MFDGPHRPHTIVFASMIMIWGAFVPSSATAKPRQADRIADAVGRLVTCKNMRANVCVIATATLTNAGDAALRPLLKSLRKMTKHGKILGMSVFENVTTPKSTRGLVKVTKDEKLPVFVRAMSIRTLGERDGRRVLKTLIKKTTDKDAVIRASAVRALGNRAHGNDKRVIAALIKAATDTDVTVRLESIMGLGLSRHPDGGPVMTNALSDTEAKIRLAALKGLSHIKYDAAVLPLIQTLLKPSKTIVTTAANALTYQTGQNLGEDYSLWKAWYDNR